MRMDCDATRSGAMQAAADAMADDIRGQGGCDGSAASAAGDELSAPCNRGKCRETRLTARRLQCSCEVLAPEANLKIAERGEDKADAQQGARLKAARHFPQIRKHCTRNDTVLNSTVHATTPQAVYTAHAAVGSVSPPYREHSTHRDVNTHHTGM